MKSSVLNSIIGTHLGFVVCVRAHAGRDPLKSSSDEIGLKGFVRLAETPGLIVDIVYVEMQISQCFCSTQPPARVFTPSGFGKLPSSKIQLV